jgi:hypothetical protein
MTTVPAPTGHAAREEWADTDFDIPDDSPLDAESDKDDEDEDWDVEMNLKVDITANSAGARARAVVAGIAARSDMSRTPGQGQSKMITFTSMPCKLNVTSEEESLDEIDDDEGISTIKVACFPSVPKPLTDSPMEMDEDLEEAFLLPQELTTLSLAPLSLAHRTSKNSLEWGDKDHTISSQSSDAYSTLGFNDTFPSSNSVSSASQGESETDDDEDEGDLEGLVIPTGLFETGHGAKQLTKILETKKNIQLGESHSKRASPNPEDDFEMGLVIDDDVDFSPSRLVVNTREASKAAHDRSKSAPSRFFPPSVRTSSRAKTDRAKSPTNPPVSSARQLERLRLSPSPPLKPVPPLRSQTSQGLLSAASSGGSSHSHKSKSSSVRGQKSHSALKASTPPATQRRLTRKASLSSLMEPSPQPVASTSSSSASIRYARYDAPTAASKAKTHTSSTSRMHGMEIDSSRPTTPSSNTPAHRLTMPTTMRLKSRPSIASVFPGSGASGSSTSIKTVVPPRPPSSLSNKSRSTAPSPKPSPPQPVGPRILRKPKRPRLYGDGTELDGFEDLPTDRDKESKYRVAPKGYGNRIPGGTYSAKTMEGAPNSTSSSKKPGYESIGRTPGMGLVLRLSLFALC